MDKIKEKFWLTVSWCVMIALSLSLMLVRFFTHGYFLAAFCLTLFVVSSIMLAYGMTIGSIIGFVLAVAFTCLGIFGETIGAVE